MNKKRKRKRKRHRIDEQVGTGQSVKMKAHRALMPDARQSRPSAYDSLPRCVRDTLAQAYRVFLLEGINMLELDTRLLLFNSRLTMKEMKSVIEVAIEPCVVMGFNKEFPHEDVWELTEYIEYLKGRKSAFVFVKNQTILRPKVILIKRLGDMSRMDIYDFSSVENIKR